MKQTVVAVFDSAVQVFGRPFFVRSVGEAIRSFSDEVNRKGSDSPFNSHPDDYSLYHLADYDDEFGRFAFPEGAAEPRMLVRGKDVLKGEE